MAKSDILAEAVKDARQYLHPNISAEATLPLHFIIFGLNAHANAEGSTFDIAFLNSLNRDYRVKLIAHEIHHNLTDQFIKTMKQPAESSPFLFMSSFNRRLCTWMHECLVPQVEHRFCVYTRVFAIYAPRYRGQ